MTPLSPDSPLFRGIAIFIDIENMGAKIVRKALLQIHKKGRILLIRAVGPLDLWTSGNWQELAQEFPMTFFDSATLNGCSKNSADMEIGASALEYLYEKPGLDAFAFISSDSDFVPVTKRVLGKGKQCWVFGTEKNTSDSLREACSEFTALKKSVTTKKKAAKKKTLQKVTKKNTTSKPPKKAAVTSLVPTFHQPFGKLLQQLISNISHYYKDRRVTIPDLVRSLKLIPLQVVAPDGPTLPCILKSYPELETKTPTEGLFTVRLRNDCRLVMTECSGTALTPDELEELKKAVSKARQGATWSRIPMIAQSLLLAGQRNHAPFMKGRLTTTLRTNPEFVFHPEHPDFVRPVDEDPESNLAQALEKLESLIGAVDDCFEHCWIPGEDFQKFFASCPIAPIDFGLEQSSEIRKEIPFIKIRAVKKRRYQVRLIEQIPIPEAEIISNPDLEEAKTAIKKVAETQTTMTQDIGLITLAAHLYQQNAREASFAKRGQLLQTLRDLKQAGIIIFDEAPFPPSFKLNPAIAAIWQSGLAWPIRVFKQLTEPPLSELVRSSAKDKTEEPDQLLASRRFRWMDAGEAPSVDDVEDVHQFLTEAFKACKARVGKNWVTFHEISTYLGKCSLKSKDFYCRNVSTLFEQAGGFELGIPGDHKSTLYTAVRILSESSPTPKRSFLLTMEQEQILAKNLQTAFELEEARREGNSDGFLLASQIKRTESDWGDPAPLVFHRQQLANTIRTIPWLEVQENPFRYRLIHELSPLQLQE